jgi:DNA-directed RNA polymerase specialized sigma24 family protein
MRRDSGDTDDRVAAYVRDRSDHHLRLAVLLTGDWHAAEDLVQTSLVKLHRARPRFDTATDPDAYLRRTVAKVQMTFGDFGIGVSVSAPPAGETVSP